MFDRISLSHFKCFVGEQSVDLARINVFYGKNGRGKSSVTQAFMLLGQAMQDSEVSYMPMNGSMVRLGMFKDVLSHGVDDGVFTLRFHLKGQEDDLVFAYGSDNEKPSVGKLKRLEADGKNLMDVKTSSEGDAGNVSKESSLSAISGFCGYENFKNIYFVSANRKGQNNSEPRNDIGGRVLGANGDNVINLLLLQGEDFQKEVAHVLSVILDGATLLVKETATREYVDLFLDSKDGGDSFRPVNVGFGYSYVLPIIVEALVVPTESLLIVENPEAHLFPAAQSRLMEFLIDTSKKRNLQLIVESHSDHVVNGVRIAVKKEALGTGEVLVNYFDRDGKGDVLVKAIHVDKYGELDDYPDDFMDEWTRQLLELT